jgi:hypothetical protein
MGYCHRCGTWASLDDDAMCGTCRDTWQPAGGTPGDLGCRRQTKEARLP